MTFIYHIAAAADWERAVRDGRYTMSTRGLTLAEQGFIHASTADQVTLVANAFYRGVPDLLLLVIDPERVAPEISYERCRGRPGRTPTSTARSTSTRWWKPARSHQTPMASSPSTPRRDWIRECGSDPR